MLVRQLVSCCVPGFLFISGYFTNVQEVKEHTKRYYLKRLKRLFCPYICYTLLYSMYNCFQMYRNNMEINLYDMIINNFLLGAAASHLYYILVLLQLCLLSPIIIRILLSNRQWIKNVLFLISPIYIAMLYVFIAYYGTYPRYYNLPFFAWFFFYYLGLYYKTNEQKMEKVVSVFGKKEMIILSLFLCCIEAILMTCFRWGGNIVANQLKCSSIVYSFTCCMYMINRKKVNNEGINKFIMKIGDLSYGIYFIHILVKQIIEAIINRLEISTWIVRFLLCGVLTMLISVVIVYVARKVLNKGKVRNLRFIFGV